MTSYLDESHLKGMEQFNDVGMSEEFQILDFSFDSIVCVST